MITRRNLLVGGAVAAGASLLTGRASADDTDFVLGGTSPAPHFKILEIFLYGALSPWESFYYEPRGMTDVYASGHTTRYADIAIATGSDRCPAIPSSSIPSTIARGPGDSWFGFGDGKPFKFAKGTKPLVARPDMLRRTRVVTMTSRFDAHVLGIAQALTGRPFGDTRAASIGSAVQRRHAALGPVSFVIMPPSGRFFSMGDYRTFEAAFFSAGLYPGAPRPIRLSLEGDNALATWAARGTSSANGDALLKHYRDRYVSRLGSANSREVETYSGVVDGLRFGPDLVTTYGLVPGSLGSTVTHCSTLDPLLPSTGVNSTRASLDLARKLFANGAKYVGMIDVGIGQDTGAAYDGHGDVAGITTGNLYNVLSELSAIVRPPGGTDPPGAPRISLDDTLVVLTTELGRTTQAQAGDGRNHHGKAYINVLIGGPIPSSPDGMPTWRGTFSGMGDGLTGSFAPWQLLSNIFRAGGINDAHPHNFAATEREYTILTGAS